MRAQLPDVRVLIEPAGRNTAAAIALATVAVDRPDDDVMIVLPADHFIRDEGVFRDVLRTAATRLATGRPRQPTTRWSRSDPGLASGDRVRLPDPAARRRAR